MKYLGVDWGLKKVGVAISEGFLASPLTVLEVTSLNQAVAEVMKIVKNEQIDQLVIGQPEGASGKLAAKAVASFNKMGVDVIPWDETLSTHQAKQILIDSGTSRSKRGEDDAMSAAIILQSYLDEHST